MITASTKTTKNIKKNLKKKKITRFSIWILYLVFLLHCNFDYINEKKEKKINNDRVLEKTAHVSRIK